MFGNTGHIHKPPPRTPEEIGIEIRAAGSQLNVFRDSVDERWEVWINPQDTPSRVEGTCLDLNRNRRVAMAKAIKALRELAGALVKQYCEDYPGDDAWRE